MEGPKLFDVDVDFESNTLIIVTYALRDYSKVRIYNPGRLGNIRHDPYHYQHYMESILLKFPTGTDICDRQFILLVDALGVFRPAAHEVRKIRFAMIDGSDYGKEPKINHLLRILTDELCINNIIYGLSLSRLPCLYGVNFEVFNLHLKYDRTAIATIIKHLKNISAAFVQIDLTSKPATPGKATIIRDLSILSGYLKTYPARIGVGLCIDKSVVARTSRTVKSLTSLLARRHGATFIDDNFSRTEKRFRILLGDEIDILSADNVKHNMDGLNEFIRANPWILGRRRLAVLHRAALE